MDTGYIVGGREHEETIEDKGFVRVDKGFVNVVNLNNDRCDKHRIIENGLKEVM